MILLNSAAFKYEVAYGDGRTETLLDIPRYDFNWQLRYEYKQPKLLPKGSSVKITAAYDNSPNNKDNTDQARNVRWGSQTVDKMVIGYLEYFQAVPSTGSQVDTRETSPACNQLPSCWPQASAAGRLISSRAAF